jgi:hypothetical protein
VLPHVYRKDRTGYWLGVPPSEAGLGSVFPTKLIWNLPCGI